MDILEVAEIIGIISFAWSGFLIAVEVKLDILGIFIASFLTALGGGVVRDVIVGRELFAFSNNYASILVILVIMIAIYFKVQRLDNLDDIEKHPLFITADTLGMVSFAISGAVIAQEVGFNFFGVILLSLITAVGGGVMRDILINKIPLILVSEFYGTVALFVGFLIFTLAYFGSLNPMSVIMVFIIGVGLRFLALYKAWHLPKI
jgi:uncharacterized membrane protein YeiH